MPQRAARNQFDDGKNVRLTSEQAKRVKRAADASGVKASDLVRDAIEKRCDEVLGGSLADELADYIGVLEFGPGPTARQSREVFIEGLMADLDPAKRRRLT